MNNNDIISFFLGCWDEEEQVLRMNALLGRDRHIDVTRAYVVIAKAFQTRLFMNIGQKQPKYSLVHWAKT